MTGIRVERARPADLDGVLDLLARLHLPLDGLRAHAATTIVARDADRIVGSAAVEMYAEGALLRSVAVEPETRGRGIGRQLAEAAMHLARERHAPAVYLLTTTAEGYFPKLGFEPVRREDVPATVQESVEFRSACPASAIAMRRRF